MSENDHRDPRVPWPDSCHEFLPCTEHASCRGCARCNFHESQHHAATSPGSGS